MRRGLFVMTRHELEGAFRDAMRIGSYATAERIGFQLARPGVALSVASWREIPKETLSNIAKKLELTVDI